MCGPNNPLYIVRLVKRFVLANDASVSCTLEKYLQLPFPPTKELGIIDAGLHLMPLKVNFDTSHNEFVFDCFVARAESEEQHNTWVQQFKDAKWKEPKNED